MSWLAFMPEMRQLPMCPMSKMQILACFIKKMWKQNSLCWVTFKNHNSFGICNHVIETDIQCNHFDLNSIAVRPAVTCGEILGMQSLKYLLIIFSPFFSFLPLEVIQYFSKFRLTDSILSLELVSSSIERIPVTLDTRNASTTIIHFITVILFFSR